MPTQRFPVRQATRYRFAPVLRCLGLDEGIHHTDCDPFLQKSSAKTVAWKLQGTLTFMTNLQMLTMPCRQWSIEARNRKKCGGKSYNDAQRLLHRPLHRIRHGHEASFKLKKVPYVQTEAFASGESQARHAARFHRSDPAFCLLHKQAAWL